MYSVKAEYIIRNSFLKLMGRHRKYFDRCILNSIDEQGSIDWLDNPFSPLSIDGDLSFYGVRFLRDVGVPRDKYNEIRKEYVELAGYPSCRSVFDAVGRTESGSLLCVDVVTDSEELKSKKRDSFIEKQITLFQCVADLMKTDVKSSWADYYGDYINKLHTTLFLNRHLIPTKYVTVCIISAEAMFEVCANYLRNKIEYRNSCLGISENSMIDKYTASCFVSMKGEEVSDLHGSTNSEDDRFAI